MCAQRRPNRDTVKRFAFTLTAPSWVEPPPTESGSIDPLGYLAPAERLAEKLLPGVTVATRRARYLSFLCWATRETEGNAREIDRWEVALSVGEYLRHGSEGNECGFLGSRRVQQLALKGGDNLPTHLHVQTARLLYSGLLRSCCLCDESGSLTLLGERIADVFDKDMPGSRPRQVSRCEAMPCLSEIRGYERNGLLEALFKSNDESALRHATFRELGGRALRSAARNGASWVLSEYLPRVRAQKSEPARLLHEAAKLELQSMPLTRLFLYLYQHGGLIRGSIPRQSSFRAYRVREDSSGLLADVAAHLRKASLLGSPIPPIGVQALAQRLCELHRLAKPEAPWVDDRWKVLRPGLQPQRAPDVHGYRLTAFASILRDLEAL